MSCWKHGALWAEVVVEHGWSPDPSLLWRALQKARSFALVLLWHLKPFSAACRTLWSCCCLAGRTNPSPILSLITATQVTSSSGAEAQAVEPP